MDTSSWIKAIDQTTRDFKHSFAGLTSEELDWKPDPDTWSIAQNMDHLITINQSYYPAIAAIRNGTYKLPFTAKFGLVVNLLGKALLKGIQPETRRKTKTFAIWEPASSDLGEKIMDRFETHHEELKEFIVDCGDLLDARTIICSPANPKIVYRLEAAFDIIVAHERRHLGQARDVLELI